MTYAQAVERLMEYLNGDFQKYESNQILNGFDRYEFIVTKLNGDVKMIQVGYEIVEKPNLIQL